MDANVDLKKSWIMIKHTFPILDNNFNWPYAQTTDAQLFETINLINRFGLNATIKSLIISKFEEHVRKFVVPKFWAFFTTDINVGEGFGNFFKAVDYLYTFFTNHIHLIGNTSLLCNSKPIYNAENATDSLKLIIRATLLSQLPLNYNKIIEEFYETALKLENNDDTACPVCGNEPECSCLIYFHATNSKLVELKLLEPLCGQVLTSLIYGYIESYINKTCKDNFDNSYIDALEKWLDQFIINWLRKVYGCDGSSELQEQEYKQKLTNLLYETYTKVRINQLFNIIIGNK
uniref:Uncharacterized protein n=1 Tax=Photinus pyralis TaxID=7054 RepID=A0A1Y1LHN2_PHOPY